MKKTIAIIIVAVIAIATVLVIISLKNQIDEISYTAIEKKVETAKEKASKLETEFNILKNYTESKKISIIEKKEQGKKKIEEVSKLSDAKQTENVQKWFRYATGNSLFLIPAMKSDDKKNLGIFFQHYENMEKEIDLDWQYIIDLEGTIAKADETIKLKNEVISNMDVQVNYLEKKLRRSRVITKVVVCGAIILIAYIGIRFIAKR